MEPAQIFHVVQFNNALVSEDEVMLCKLTERRTQPHTPSHTDNQYS